MSLWRKFQRDQNGGPSIEFVLWSPIFMMLLVLAVDASFTLVTYSQMWNATRETGRQMALGTLTTESEVQDYARNHLPSRSDFVITADFNHSFNQVQLRISVDAADTGVFGVLTKLSGNTMSTATVVRQEWLPVAGSRAGFKI